MPRGQKKPKPVDDARKHELVDRLNKKRPQTSNEQWERRYGVAIQRVSRWRKKGFGSPRPADAQLSLDTSPARTSGSVSTRRRQRRMAAPAASVPVGPASVADLYFACKVGAYWAGEGKADTEAVAQHFDIKPAAVIKAVGMVLRSAPNMLSDALAAPDTKVCLCEDQLKALLGEPEADA